MDACRAHRTIPSFLGCLCNAGAEAYRARLLSSHPTPPALSAAGAAEPASVPKKAAAAPSNEQLAVDVVRVRPFIAWGT
jgi:hypothetical protein